MRLELLSEIIDYDMEEFRKTFGCDTGELLELIFSRFYNSSCAVKMYFSSFSDLVQIECIKYVLGEEEHVGINYNMSDIEDITVEDFLSFVNKQIREKFIEIQVHGTDLVDEIIDDYISPRKED